MGLFIIMKPKNNPTDSILAFDLFKFFPSPKDQKIYVSKTVSPNLIYVMEDILTESWKFVYYDEDISVCPVCQAPLNHNGTSKLNLNKNLLIYKQTYKCPDKKCNFTKITHPEDFIAKHCNYAKEIKEKPQEYSFISYLSYQIKTEMLNLHFGTEMSRQTIYNAQNDNIDNLLAEQEKKLFEDIKKLKINYSGIYCYDEEYIKVSKEVYVRMTLVDFQTKIIVNDQIIPKEDFNQETVKKYLKSSLKGLKLKTIVTDGLKIYDEIIEELGAKHQKCVFHIMQGLMTPLQKLLNKKNKKINDLEKRINKKTKKLNDLYKKTPNKKGRAKKTDIELIKNRQKIKKLKLEISEAKFQKRKLKKEIKEYNHYKEKIQLIFKSKTYKTAMKRYNELKENIKNLPKIFQDFLENLETKIDKALNHTLDKDIPKTNNLIELIFRTTFPGKIKTIFRTLKGAKRQIRMNNIRWMKRNVLGQE